MKLLRWVAAAAPLCLLVFPIVASAQTMTRTSLQAEVQSLLAEIQSLQQKLAAVQGGTTPTWCHIFSTNLEVGSTGSDVTALQQALARDGESISFSGSFDEQTASAVSGFQQKYASLVLTPNGLQHGTGYVGRATRAELNSLFGCNNSTSMTTSPTSTQTPFIRSLSPPSGPVGTTITLIGSGFTPTGNMVEFSGKDAAYSVDSPNGTTLTFPVPSALYGLCPASMPQCPTTMMFIQATTYNVAVSSNARLSNSVPFTVTSSTVLIVPTVTISANPTTITLGQSTTLTWTSTNATMCTDSGMWGGSQILGSMNSSQSVTPVSAGANTYTMTCTGPGGTSTPASVTITVNSAT